MTEHIMETFRPSNRNIGKTVGGVRKTEGGYVWEGGDEWWYFLRDLPGKENPYWYKKRRTSPTNKNPEGKVEEEYVGKNEESLPFKIPTELR